MRDKSDSKPVAHSAPPELGATAVPKREASARMAAYALLFGNFIVGSTVLAPAGMLKELAADLDVSLGKAGLLVTFGAIVLCIGSPLVAWATGRVERRTLLVATMAVMALGHAASAWAPTYSALLLVRLATLAVAAIFTPQAASTIAAITPEKQRSAAVALVFLGWSLAVAAGLPLITHLAADFGWRQAYLFLAIAAAVSLAFLSISLPKGLSGTPVSFRSWGTVLRSRRILLILLVTILSSAGQFLLVTYLGPLLARLINARPNEIALFFGGLGVTGFLGNVAATRAVGKLGAFVTSLICFVAMFVGMSFWSFGAGSAVLMAIGVLTWGLGFASSNSMQQARLVEILPELSSATIALNTSSIYVGQMAGSAIGGFLIERDCLIAMGYLATVVMFVVILTVLQTRPGKSSAYLAGN